MAFLEGFSYFIDITLTTYFPTDWISFIACFLVVVLGNHRRGPEHIDINSINIELGFILLQPGLTLG